MFRQCTNHRRPAMAVTFGRTCADQVREPEQYGAVSHARFRGSGQAFVRQLGARRGSPERRLAGHSLAPPYAFSPPLMAHCPGMTCA